MIVEYLTYIVSAAIIITKYIDCITTQRKIKGIGMEMNPIARTMMQKIGIKGAIWLIFVITILTTILCQLWIQLKTEAIYWDYGYIITGSFTAIVQGATALNNHQGRPNLITKQLFRVLSKNTYSIVLVVSVITTGCSVSTEGEGTERPLISTDTSNEELVEIERDDRWVRYKDNVIEYNGDKAVLPFPEGYLDSLSTVYTSTRLKELVSYSTSGKKDIELIEYAKEEWMDLESIEILSQRKFSTSFFDDNVDFSSNVDSVIYENDEYALVYLKMRPNDGSLYGGGIHPGLGYIIKLDKRDGRYSFASSTGLIKYAMKYAADPHLMKVHLDHAEPYLEVRTSASGVGVGREGINLYDLEHLENIIYSNILLTYKNSIYWMPGERNKVLWILQDLHMDTSKIHSEVHIDGYLDHQYALNANRDSLEIITSLTSELKTWTSNENDYSSQEFKDSIHGIKIHSFYIENKNGQRNSKTYQ